MLDDQVLIGAGGTTVAVDAAIGGRIAQITVGEQPLLVAADPTRAPTITWGSFPMAPWAGRIRHGRFTFDGVAHQLDCNHTDVHPGRPGEHRHAIHGTVFGRAWTVEQRDGDSVTLGCPLTGALAWPFEGVARQRIEVFADAVRCVLSVESLGAAFPAVIGWHPWFLAPADLRFHPRAMYARDDDGITTSVLVDPVPPPWDDCFVVDEEVVDDDSRRSPATQAALDRSLAGARSLASPRGGLRSAVAMVYHRAVAPVVTVSSDCDHWVLFDGVAGSLCVEPQSGPPDGPNIAPAVVRPGTALTRSMRISW